MINDPRFSRQELLFGREGQQKIEETAVAVAGVGGNGTHVIQHLAHLGTRRFVLVEPGELKVTSKNRYIGHRHDDPIPGTHKLEIAERLIRSVSPAAEIISVSHALESPEATESIAKASIVFGCVDDDGPRFVLNELSARLGQRFIDVATEILPDEGTGKVRYGGRVFVKWDHPGCLACCELLDMDDVGRFCASPEERKNRDAIYGVRQEDSTGSGPSVVTLNGVVSSIAATEFMVGVTGLRVPIRHTTYRGDLGRFTVSKDEPKPDCYTCGTAAPLRPLA